MCEYVKLSAAAFCAKATGLLLNNFLYCRTCPSSGVSELATSLVVFLELEGLGILVVTNQSI